MTHCFACPKYRAEENERVCSPCWERFSLKPAVGREGWVAMYFVGGEEICRRKERLLMEKKVMKDFQSNSSSHTSFRSIDFCHCKIRSPLRTSWTTINLGWCFFGCGIYKVQQSFLDIYYHNVKSLYLTSNCLSGKWRRGYFHWYDPPLNARDKDIINRLLQWNKKLEGQMQSYKRRATWAVWCMLACWIAMLFYVIGFLF